jgi:AbrB family looped-hinge helix DNA binding protein
MITTVSTRGQIVLPAEIRQLDAVTAGQRFEVERLDRGDYRLRRIYQRPNEGLVDWLLACPVKAFLAERLSAETTDDIQPGLR